MNTVMKKCCGLCPYSRKNTLFIHPERAEDFAYQASNPYTSFVCHKTGVINEDHPDEERQSEIVRGENSLTCAGFHVMQHLIQGSEEGAEIEVDFEDHFSEVYEMTEHHEAKYYEEH
jgi:uncharacterized protein YchJ